MRNKIQIAIADDHELFRKGMAAILNANEAMQVSIQAENGFLLLEEIEKIGMPDVVLLDLEMPVMDGFKTLEALKKKDPDSKVILLSMHSDERFILHFMESGANGYLHKNTKPQEVENAILKVMESGFYFNDNVSKILLSGVQKKNKAVPSLPGQESLNEREIEVLKLLCMELTTSEIGKKLFLSPRTIEGYRKQLFEKTGAKNIAGLVIYAIRMGLITV
ncbi:MAG: response regulator transcription factor [Flavobacteriales bacterium]|nr:response regulator transcription factor [Flavobacteriales bacterium]